MVSYGDMIAWCSASGHFLWLFSTGQGRSTLWQCLITGPIGNDSEAIFRANVMQRKAFVENQTRERTEENRRAVTKRTVQGN